MHGIRWLLLLALLRGADEAEDLARQEKMLQARGRALMDPMGALEMFKSIAPKKPNHAASEIRHAGWGLMNAKKYEHALLYFNTAERLHTNVVSLRGVIHALMMLGEHNKANPLFKRAFAETQAPDETKALLYLLAHNQINRKEDHRAKATTQKLLEHDRESAEAKELTRILKMSPGPLERELTVAEVRAVMAQEKHLPPLEPSSALIALAPGHCILQFERYEPSRWEQLWHDNQDTWKTQICEVLQESKREVGEWLSGLNDTHPSHDIFSHMLYQTTCKDDNGRVNVSCCHSRPIEPIVGLMRHPYAACMDVGPPGTDEQNDALLQSRDAYLLERGNDFHLLHRPRGRGAIVFDLGSGRYPDSSKWFVENYRARGIDIERVIAWEVQPIDASVAIRAVDPDIRPRYTLYNVPVSPWPSSGDHPWRYLKDLCTRDDFVVVKLDVDNVPLERYLIHQLLKDPDTLALIDEMFFEHHVFVGPMLRYWGISNPLGETMTDAWELVRKLRHAGVRMHGWP